MPAFPMPGPRCPAAKVLYPPMILYFATDLIWASKIKGVADALGIPCRPVRNVEMLAARLADSAPRAILIDLTSPDVALTLIRALKGTTGANPLPDQQPAQQPHPQPNSQPNSQPDPLADPQFDQARRAVRIVAFGPHVEKDLFQQARDAGAEEVLTRGRLDHDMSEILLRLSTDARL